ncbi:MAG TPA: M23 family metallopeptidase [Chryseosolibacter sp.]|nr:M23 family metallopeptidase [Chryseosolibacter sp.]
MRYTTYRYNTHTCQYERVKIHARDIVWYLLGLMVTASCLLVGILLLHDLVVNTENEKRLRRENRALRQHHAILSKELDALQPVLASLQKKEHMLHARVFGSPPPTTVQQPDRASKEKLLLADVNSFRDLVSSMKRTSQQLIDKSSATNRYFASAASLREHADELANAWPTLQPVSPWNADRMISGFGPRVNPFHKGLYDHLGVDVAMPRGTPVIATASGTVKQLKRSPLQAGYGNYIEIDHGNGIVTRYAHLEDIHVKFGAKVRKGEVIGTIGTSGGSVAPHLHYEILREGKNVDPVRYMVEGLSSEEHHRLTKISQQQNQSLD